MSSSVELLSDGRVAVALEVSAVYGHMRPPAYHKVIVHEVPNDSREVHQALEEAVAELGEVLEEGLDALAATLVDDPA
jgi:uncharacterized protein YciW